MIWVFLTILATHWFADFVCQTDWQAQNKSKSLVALGRHVGVYTLILTAVCLVAFRIQGVVEYALLNGALHFATDFCTSRISSKLYAKGDVHNFFVVVGLDQLIHQATLLITLQLMFGT
ncbi:MAG: DUF3307 domain-containing protein [Nitrososphaerales archaeon]